MGSELHGPDRQAYRETVRTLLAEAEAEPACHDVRVPPGGPPGGYGCTTHRGARTRADARVGRVRGGTTRMVEGLVDRGTAS